MDDYSWSKYNEADVREEIIAPLLRRLGYQTGTKNNIIREQQLRYEKSYLGHKKPKRDWPLIGKADYICEVEGIRRWTIEAKSPNEEITIDDVEQAFSYARHPEVKAIYYCLCNGRELRVYQTESAPNVEPILSMRFEEYKDESALENLLAPSALIKNHPMVKLDFGQPLGKNLGSLIRITGGHIIFDRSEPVFPAFIGYTVFITGGAVQRDQRGLIALLNSLSPFEPLQKLNERLGLTNFEVYSADSALSSNADKPTTFRSTRAVLFAKGEKLYDFTQAVEVILPHNITCEFETVAQGVLHESIFEGVFQVRYHYLELNFSLSFDGKFKINVA